MTLKPKIAQYVADIVAALQNAGYEAYIVGGAVRDFLLDRQPKDYDLSTSATPEEIKKVFRKQRCMIIGRRFRLVHLYHGKEILEISTFRRKPEHAAPAPAKMNPEKLAAAPENMIFRDNEFGTAQEDAWRRDFTVNALFYDPVNDKIVDYTGQGLEDIRNGIVRIIGDPVTRLEEDPVRILRALKLVGQYNFRMEEATERAVRSCMHLIRLASDSRMTLELEKILKNPFGDRILETFHEYGFLEYFLLTLQNAIRAAEGEIKKAIQKTQFWDSLRGISLNPREIKIINMLHDGFKGKLTTAKWAKLGKCSHSTALRDINDLISKGILIADGGNSRNAGYMLRNEKQGEYQG